MKKIVVEYNSNNSGGDWWLKDNDWKNLEKNGWKVNYGKEYIFKNGEYTYDKDGTPKLSDKIDDFYSDDGRYLGALAKTAWKVFDDIKQGLKEFEQITNQDVTDNGCNCCGAPHSFRWWEQGTEKDGKHGEWKYASGEDLSEYLYRNI